MLTVCSCTQAGVPVSAPRNDAGPEISWFSLLLMPLSEAVNYHAVPAGDLWRERSDLCLSRSNALRSED